MKFSYFLIIPLTFALVSCGSSDEEGEVSPPSSSITGAVVNNPPTAANPTPPPVVSPTPTPAPDNGDSSACPTNPSEAIYVATVSGTGPYKDNTSTSYIDTYKSVSTFNGVRAIRTDQKLRVSIKPSSSGSVGNTGGSHTYTKMGMRVALVKNNVVLETKEIGLGTGTNGLKTGIPTGQNSNASLLDFSGSVQSSTGGDTGYSIRIYEVMTSYGCATYCTKSYYDCRDYNEGGGYWCSANPSVYKWNYDYNRNTQTCCYGSVIDDCNRLKCGVGYDANNASWSVEVRVETDHTGCIQ